KKADRFYWNRTAKLSANLAPDGLAAYCPSRGWQVDKGLIGHGDPVGASRYHGPPVSQRPFLPMPHQRIKTPCVGLCSTVYGDQVCRGCKRFHHEVVNWNAYSDDEKRAVWRRLEVLLVQVMQGKVEVFDAGRLRAQLEQHQV